MNESYFHCLLKFQKKFLWPSLENTIIDLSHLNKLFCLINYLSLKLFIFYHSITIFQGKDDILTRKNWNSKKRIQVLFAII